MGDSLEATAVLPDVAHAPVDKVIAYIRFVHLDLELNYCLTCTVWQFLHEMKKVKNIIKFLCKKSIK
jgi:hypothetical protein